MSQAQNIAEDKAKVASMEELAGKPVTEIAQEIADSTPAPKEPAAEPTPGKTSEEIANEAAEKGRAEYEARLAEIVADAEARREALDEQGKQHIEDAKRKLNPPTPIDELDVPMEMADATAMKTAQIVWLKALKEGKEEVGIKAVSDNLGKHSKTLLPLVLGNVSLNADMAKVILDAYPDYTKEVQALAALDSGKDLMIQAGYDEKTIKKMPQDVLDHWAMTKVYDQHFETEGPGILERLKSHKATIAEALGNDKVQRSLKWAGLIVGCATGGIVVKAGVTGAQFLASKMAENPAVQGLAKTLEDKSIKFVSKTFNIDEAKVRANVDKAKGIAETVSNSKWAKLGKVAALVGLGVALGNIDFVKDAAHVVAEQSASLLHSSLDVASQVKDATMEFASEKIHDAGVYAADSLHSVAQAVDPRVVEGVDASKSYADLGGLEGSNTLLGDTPPSADPAVVGDVLATPETPTSGEASSAPGVTTVEVKHGDSLWKIAERHLEANGVQATNSEINKLVGHIYDTNKEVIGNNPDLIFDHQKLVIDVPSLGTPEAVVTLPVSVDPVPSQLLPDVGMIDTKALPSTTDDRLMRQWVDPIPEKSRVVDDSPQIC